MAEDDGSVMRKSASGAKSEQSDCMQCMTEAAETRLKYSTERKTHEGETPVKTDIRA